MSDATPKSLSDLVAVMAALRAPNTGCPWDLEQTFATIAPYTIEEAYEVADAIARKDMADLKEELGDLLLQAVYHSQLAAEQNAFTLDDVIDGITRKMIRRHPHVFGDEAARTAGAAKGFWEKVKSEERAARGATRSPLLGLDLFPEPLGRSRSARSLVAEHMGMPTDHFPRDAVDDVVKCEGVLLGSQLRMIDRLQQQIAQLFLQIGHVLSSDRVGDFVGFLDGVGRDGCERLLQIPRAAGVWRAQRRHDGDEVGKALWRCVGHGRSWDECGCRLSSPITRFMRRDLSEACEDKAQTRRSHNIYYGNVQLINVH